MSDAPMSYEVARAWLDDAQEGGEVDAAIKACADALVREIAMLHESDDET